jgi:Tol biopolymer transport system component
MNNQDIDRIVGSWLAVDRGQVDPQVVESALTDASRRPQRRGFATVLAGERAWPRSRDSRSSWSRSTRLRVALLAVVGLIFVVVSAALFAGGPQVRLGLTAPSASLAFPSASPIDRPNSSDVVANGTVVYSTGCLHTVDIATGVATQNCDQLVYSLPGGGTSGDSWSWSPDGHRAISLGPTSLVLRGSTDPTSTPIRGTEWRARPGIGVQEQFLGWSPRGTYVAWIGESSSPGQWSIFVGPVDDARRSTVTFLGYSGSHSDVLWSADESRAILASDVTSDVRGLRLAKGDGSPLPGAITFDGTNFLGLSDDGSRLLFLAPIGGGSPATPVAIGIAIGDGLSAPTAVTSFPAGTFAVAAALAPDNSTLAVVTSRREAFALSTLADELWVVKKDGSRQRFDLTLPVGASPEFVAWSADGAHVIVTSHEGERGAHPYQRWAKVVSALDGQAIVEDAGGAVFSPDGRHVLYDVAAANGSRDFILMDLSTGRSRRIGGALLSLGEASQLSWWP